MEDNESVQTEWDIKLVEETIQKNFDKILNRDSLYLHKSDGSLQSEFDVARFVLNKTIFEDGDISHSFNDEFWVNLFKYIESHRLFRYHNKMSGVNEEEIFYSARESCRRLIEYTTMLEVIEDPQQKSRLISEINKNLSTDKVIEDDGWSINFYPSYYLKTYFTEYANSILVCNRVIFVLSFCELLRHKFEFDRFGVSYTHGYDSDGHKGAYFKNVLTLLAFGGSDDDTFHGFSIMRMHSHTAEENNAIFRDLRSLILGEVVSIAITVRDKYNKSENDNSYYSKTRQDEDDFNDENSSEDDESEYDNSYYSKTRQDEGDFNDETSSEYDESDYNSDSSKSRQDEYEFNGKTSSEQKNVTNSSTSKSLLGQFKNMNIYEIIQHLIAINESL